LALLLLLIVINTTLVNLEPMRKFNHAFFIFRDSTAIDQFCWHADPTNTTMR